MYTDLTYLREITRNNKDVIEVTINKFSASIPESLSKIKKGLISEDWDTVGAEAHKLLSSVGILRIKKMEKLVRTIETYCKEREHLWEVPKMVDEVKEISRYVLMELAEVKATLESPKSVKS